ncbi:MAG TPA: cyclodeaminase/cyclohydrolase family protein [Solirubrobacteraceae bacterium]|jgi:formiminotetrahydrofolate cyclodeaminase|nr:cyclodeaminase/cyclohydrolase family protein [Solirubrobacteraceae bacterium]
MPPFADLPLQQIVESVAARDPTPGAGPALAWTCALAAALVEMTSAVMLRKESESPAAVEARRERAHALRTTALTLADLDAAAYAEVLAVQRRRDEPGHPQRLRQVLADAADPLVRIIETAREVAELATGAIADARGGVRGEAITALVLAAGVARGAVPLVELNLASDPQDPRRAQVREAAAAATDALERTIGPGASSPG